MPNRTLSDDWQLTWGLALVGIDEWPLTVQICERMREWEGGPGLLNRIRTEHDQDALFVDRTCIAIYWTAHYAGLLKAEPHHFDNLQKKAHRIATLSDELSSLIKQLPMFSQLGRYISPDRVFELDPCLEDRTIWSIERHTERPAFSKSWERLLIENTSTELRARWPPDKLRTADMLNALASHARSVKAPKLIPSINETSPRRFFIRQLAEHFEQTLRERLTSEVAQITSVAFSEKVTAKEVGNALDR